MSRRRVVITGMAMVTPLGSHPDRILDRIFAGDSAVTLVSSGREGLAAPVLLAPVEERVDEAFTPLQRLAMDPVAQMATRAAHLALADAGFVDGDAGVEGPVAELADAGVYMGCGLGGAQSYEDAYTRYFARDVRRLKPTTVPRVMPNAPAAHISLTFGTRGPSHTFSVACTSSAVALGEAFRAIRDGYLECAVAGGAEAMLSGGVVLAWEAMGVLAKLHDDGPGASVRPFDRARTGFALGEGAAVLVLESGERAASRGARVLGEICGYGATSDAHNLTEPASEGQTAAMRHALDDAGLSGSEVDYVNAHATGTQVGDAVEAEAIRAALGTAADHVPVSSTKGAHGHLVGAAGAVEAAVTLGALRRGQLPPTANLGDPDPACPVVVIRNGPRACPKAEFALTNSFGFGGANATLVLRRTDG